MVSIVLHYFNIFIKNFAFDFILGTYVINPSLPNQDLHNLFGIFIQNSLPYLDDIYGKKSVYQVPSIDVLAK